MNGISALRKETPESPLVLFLPLAEGPPPNGAGSLSSNPDQCGNLPGCGWQRAEGQCAKRVWVLETAFEFLIKP